MPMPDEPWRRRLRPASFRGATFKVDVSGFIFGRRTVTHEFVNRDVPAGEDLGRRARRYAVAAHIVGGNYDRERDALIRALETEGPGRLVHPYLGELQVRVEQPANVTERADRGRMCEIEVVFVESGEAASTAPAQNAGAALDRAAGTAEQATATGVDSRLAEQAGGTIAV